MKTNVKVLALLCLAVFLFFWRITLSNQFSLLVDGGLANAAYANVNYAAASAKHGVLPAWDPYTHAGRPFAAQAGNGVFDPLRLVAYAWPFAQSGLLSKGFYNVCYVLAHLLAAICMFLLARELTLSRPAAFVAALCFGLGGFMGRAIQPEVLQTALWLPLVLLLLIRASDQQETAARFAYACLSGLAFGAALLGGGLDIGIMQALVLASAAIYIWATRPAMAGVGSKGWVSTPAVLGVVGIVAIGFAAVQLLPALEYSRHALRLLGNNVLPASRPIPYAALGESFPPRALLGLLVPVAPGSETFTAYFGVVPLLLALLGVWLAWHERWVRYLAGLAVVSFFCTLGSFSFLYALGYSLVPGFWHLQDSGRFIYVTHFATAILAGWGAQRLFFPQPGDEEKLRKASRLAAWAVAIFGGLLMLPAVVEQLRAPDQLYLWFLFLLGGCGLFWWILRGNRGGKAQFLLAALVLVELSAFAWEIPEKAVYERKGSDEMQKLASLRNVAAFLKRQPGLFRVQVEGNPSPGFGPLFGVQTVGGLERTVVDGYQRYESQVPKGMQMLNVRYLVRPARKGQPSLYSDGRWEVLELPGGLPRAWLVHEAIAAPNRDAVFRAISEPSFEPGRAAMVENAIPPIEPKVQDAPEEVLVESYSANRIALRARAASRALLVISEVHYPGWKATIEGGKEAPIYRVNGILRGIIIPAGESRVLLRYSPISLIAGAVTSVAVLLTALVIVILWRTRRSTGPLARHEHA